MLNDPTIANAFTDAFFSTLPSIIIGLIFVGGAFAAVILFKRVVRKMQFGDESRQRLLKAWAEVESYLQAGDEAHLRMAVITADAVLDMALKAKMFPGQTLNDRLRVATYKYRNLRRVRWAHGLRNTLAHEPLRPLSRRDGQAAIGAFRAALKELGAL